MMIEEPFQKALNLEIFAETIRKDVVDLVTVTDVSPLTIQTEMFDMLPPNLNLNYSMPLISWVMFYLCSIIRFSVLTILIIMIAIMEIVKTTIIVGNRNILRPQTSMAHSLTKIILVQIQEITRWLTHHLRMHRSALRIRLSLINSSSKISTEAMFRMWLVRLSLKRRSVHHMDSLFLTMMIAPSRGKIIRMKALKKSQLHLKALFIKETSIASK